MGGGIVTPPNQKFAPAEDTSSHGSYVADVKDILLSDLEQTVEYFVEHPSDEA
jgi:hypothetical protein